MNVKLLCTVKRSALVRLERQTELIINYLSVKNKA